MSSSEMMQTAGAPQVTGYRSDERMLHRDAMRSWSLPSRFYTTQEAFDLERERIFHRTWQYVCHVEDLPQPGSYQSFDFADRYAFVIRDSAGGLRAFHNVCRHRGHRLVSDAGRCAAGIITCPYHAWTYHSDGRLRSARGTSGLPDFDPADFRLREVRVETFLNLVFVNFDPDAQPLAEQTGGLADEIRHYVPGVESLTRAASREWRVRCNWKIVLDNFLECNHCQVAHPGFARLVDLETYRAQTHGQYTTLTMDGGEGGDSAYHYDADDPTQCAVFWHLWPMLTFNVVPGPANMALFYVRPLGPNLTLEISDYYYESAELTPEQQARIDFGNDTVQAEDILLCESVQRGMESGAFTQGRFICNPQAPHISEHAVHHFQLLVAQSLGLPIQD